jgi:hypothetical protein
MQLSIGLLGGAILFQFTMAWYFGIYTFVATTFSMLYAVVSIGISRYEKKWEKNNRVPLSTSVVHDALTDKQWRTLEERIRLMNETAVISLVVDKYGMTLTDANKKRLAECGFVMTEDRLNAVFKGHGG